MDFTNAKVLIHVKNLKIDYRSEVGPIHAVDGVSFQIRERENLGLIGESGCGKSTIAKGLVQLVPNGSIVDGQVLLRDQDLLQLNPKQMQQLLWNEIAMVPQAAMDSLDPVYRVGDQIVEVIRLHNAISAKDAYDQVAESFRTVGIKPDRMRDYPHHFSGGMKQRAIIAMALVLNPSLLILDEPTTGLDTIMQAQILDELKMLKEKFKISMLTITHDISVVEEICDAIAIMYAGEIVEYGPKDVVLDKPLHPYNLGLQNAFPSMDDDKQSLISIPGAPPLLINPPRGCRFKDRCPFKKNHCDSEPHLEEIEPGHFSACHETAQIGTMRRLAQEVDTWQNTVTS